jgi:hypothetical protein
MSRYVTKKHGLVIGSDNIFFVVDRNHPEGVEEFRDGYNSIVAFYGYRFERSSTANCWLLTPAQQLCWSKQSRPEVQTFGSKPWTIDKQFWTLRSSIERWLNEHIGARYDRWDTYTECENSNRTLFFKRRKDALAFCAMIDSLLAGIKFSV